MKGERLLNLFKELDSVQMELMTAKKKTSRTIDNIRMELEARGYEWYKPTQSDNDSRLPFTFGWRRAFADGEKPLYTIEHKFFDFSDAYDRRWRDAFIYCVEVTFHRGDLGKVTFNVRDIKNYEYYERIACEINQIIIE